MLQETFFNRALIPQKVLFAGLGIDVGISWLMKSIVGRRETAAEMTVVWLRIRRQSTAGRKPDAGCIYKEKMGVRNVYGMVLMWILNRRIGIRFF